ncbi:hypothetical protein WMY93_034088 [Mugilogobius chulae]|uniref:Uncharacterized protein n=1 Tax=Mugilogobius chulae TaxID=88201 RepID=A0AAW0MQQ7_9GOBI
MEVQEGLEPRRSVHIKSSFPQRNQTTENQTTEKPDHREPDHRETRPQRNQTTEKPDHRDSSWCNWDFREEREREMERERGGRGREKREREMEREREKERGERTQALEASAVAHMGALERLLTSEQLRATGLCDELQTTLDASDNQHKLNQNLQETVSGLREQLQKSIQLLETANQSGGRLQTPNQSGGRLQTANQSEDGCRRPIKEENTGRSRSCCGPKVTAPQTGPRSKNQVQCRRKSRNLKPKKTQRNHRQTTRKFKQKRFRKKQKFVEIQVTKDFSDSAETVDEPKEESTKSLTKEQSLSLKILNSEAEVSPELIRVEAEAKSKENLSNLVENVKENVTKTVVPLQSKSPENLEDVSAIKEVQKSTNFGENILTIPNPSLLKQRKSEREEDAKKLPTNDEKIQTETIQKEAEVCRDSKTQKDSAETVVEPKEESTKGLTKEQSLSLETSPKQTELEAETKQFENNLLIVKIVEETQESLTQTKLKPPDDSTLLQTENSAQTFSQICGNREEKEQHYNREDRGGNPGQFEQKQRQRRRLLRLFRFRRAECRAGKNLEES